ncbi:TPR repeat region-containing protein [Mycobacteroides abscessus]|uniref:TPR repeat region-containing protein n=1 Tax=Mycobacteroides abscessus TaxID=36809 RepID=UPI0009A70D41|nr:hypothetical protein [Mycobacteroides abscessus]MBN7314145.1 hypothetical protein [Mycobacteroides abscessus subsp. abscessus]SKG10226.1 Uncharacterised protein [Mycobacteroides abscessus subsp. massiliense]
MAGRSLRLLLASDPEHSMAGLRLAMSALTELQQDGQHYKRAIDRPGGSDWQGKAAGAAQDTAAADEKMLYSVTQHGRDAGAEALNTLAFKVKESHSKAVQIHDDMTSHGYTVAEDLTVNWIVPPGARPQDIAKAKDVAARVTKELQAAYDTWWTAEEGSRAEIRAIASELNTSYNPIGGLTAAGGHYDGAYLQGGTQWEPDVLARVQAASTLDDGQLQTLAAGGNIDIGSNRMQYLYQLAHSFDGKSEAEIAAIKSSLPPAQQTALTRALALAANDQVKSGVSNASGVTDATKKNFIPAAGSLANLPDSVRSALTRPDRIGYESAGMSGVGSTQLRGVGDLQDVAKIFSGADGYLNGSEAGKAMLGAATDYTNADINSHKGLPIDVTSDAHGDLKSALADVYHVAANDHVDVSQLAHDSVGGPKDADSFLKALNLEHWGDQSGKLSDVFNWAAHDPNDPLAGQLASSEAHYMSDHKSEFQNLAEARPISEYGQPNTFGSVNHDLAKAAFDAIAPHEAQLAGAGRASGLQSPAVEAFHDGKQLQDMYSVADQSRDTAQVINAEGHHQADQLLSHATERGGPHGSELEVSGRLLHGMAEGAADQLQASPDGADAAAKQLLGKMPGFDKAVDLQDFVKNLMQQPPDEFAKNLAHANTGTLAFQSTLLDSLLQHHPEIASNEFIKQYVTPDHHVNYDAIRADQGAADKLANWFTQEAPKLGVDQDKFAAGRDRGNNDEWTLGPR